MRTFTLKDHPAHSQEIIDYKNNVFVRFYSITNGFGFRFVQIKDNKEIDPIHPDSSFNWVYGPINHLKQVRKEAFKFYIELNQK